MLKSEMTLGSTLFRAPPGGPIAPHCNKSSIFFQFNSLPRSYNPLRSMNVFSSASGCCVPYVSIRGMLKSSINVISFLPNGGPYVSFVRFSVDDSRFRCRSMEEVRLEKFIVKDWNLSGSSPVM